MRYLQNFTFQAEALFALRGFCVLRRGKGRLPLAPHTPILATTILPSLRSGQFPLDEAEHFLHDRIASVATLRWCSGSPRNAVRIPSGIFVQLRRNPQTGAAGAPPGIGFAIALPQNWNGWFLL
jgi:hypothetical protein